MSSSPRTSTRAVPSESWRSTVNGSMATTSGTPGTPTLRPMFYSVSLPKSPAAPARARQLLDRVNGELPPERLDDARLLISEIVTNAVEHVREDGDIEVRIRFADGVLRV